MDFFEGANDRIRMVLYGAGATNRDFPHIRSYGLVSGPAGPQLCGLKKLWFDSVLVPGWTEFCASCVVNSWAGEDLGRSLSACAVTGTRGVNGDWYPLPAWLKASGGLSESAITICRLVHRHHLQLGSSRQFALATSGRTTTRRDWKPPTYRMRGRGDFLPCAR